MEFTEVLQQRQSVRAYRKNNVEPAKVEKILEAVRTSPTAGNFQAYEIYVLADPESIAKIAGATYNQTFVQDAPILLVFCTHAARCQYDNPEHWALQDTSIAATIAHLAITDLGLSTCWIGAFDAGKVSDILRMPNEHRPVAILTLGYAAEQPPRTERRELKEFVHWVCVKDEKTEG